MLRCRSNGRGLDWLGAAMIIAWGVALISPGSSFGSSVAFQAMSARMTEDHWAWCFLSIGMFRIASLLINGYWRQSPLLRAGAAGFGMIIWMTLALGFLDASIDQQIVIVGTLTNTVLFFSDWVCCFRAGWDYMSSRNQHGHPRANRI